MRSIIITSLIVFAATFSLAQAPPLVDGDCSEYDGLRAASHVVSPDVTLRLYQDKHFVWLCFGYPAGSFGTADLKLKSPAFPTGINLHASAQLGEWPLDKPDLAPKTAESDLWWNHKDWTANSVWINGMDTSGERPRYRFKNAKAREFQLSKQRFGRGRWNFSLEVRAIVGADGKMYTATFPKSGDENILVK